MTVPFRYAGAALATAALALSVAPATAAPVDYAPPEVSWTGSTVHLAPDGSAAYVLGKYRCYGGEEGTHLWVSVKQGEALSPENTSSQFADAWYDTNYMFEESPAGLTVDCDGRWHTTRYELRPSTWGDFGDFHDGEVLVQFCLFDSTATEDGAEGFAFDYAMTPIYVP